MGLVHGDDPEGCCREGGGRGVHVWDRITVAIGHGDCPEDAAALEALLKAAGAKNVVTGYVGGVIGAHTGPGVLVVFFLGKNR